MNTRKYVIASLVAGVFLLFYGFIVNAILLVQFWEANTAPGLMRADEDVVMWAVVVSCLLQGFALGFIFTRGYEGKGIGEGLRFGLLIAWFVAALYLLFYSLQPWSLNSTIVSILADGLMYVLAGIVLAALYRG